MTFGYIYLNSSVKDYSPVECDARLQSCRMWCQITVL